MDAHPIPQNVTSFQFKLVGDMTLKQFAYLAFGAIIAYVSFVFLSPTTPILAWPIIAISASLGAAFAFLPIADRPLDYWVRAYLKAIYSSTKMEWLKNNQTDKEDPYFINRLSIYTHNLNPQAATLPFASQPISPSPAIKPSTAQIPQQPKQTTPPATQSDKKSPSKDELSKTVELAKEAQELQMKIIQSQKELSEIKKTENQTNPEQSTNQINQVLTNLNQMIGEASEVKKELAETTHQTAVTTSPAKVEIVVLAKSKPSQIVLTTSPNVINGIVVDTLGNYLDSVVVVIYNKDGLPVRALKTNKLGQFSGATPLPNATYTMQLEKDNLAFDVLQITLDGKVISPIMIAAKRLIANSQ